VLRAKDQHNGSFSVSVETAVNGVRADDLCACGVLTEQEVFSLEQNILEQQTLRLQAQMDKTQA